MNRYTKRFSRQKDRPACFGILEKVFPVAEEGLRSTPESCIPCYHKTECLRTAMEGADGLSVREEMIDRAYRCGRMGFLERWSRRKTIQRQRSHRIDGKK